MTHPWPLFDLRIQTPRLELRAPNDDDLLELLEVARAGVHDPAFMPFKVAWTDLPPPEFERGFLRFFWGSRASWTPADWHLPLSVAFEGRLVGVQDVVASEFATTRTVKTGSWLGRAFQGRGVGTEMRAAVLFLAFEGLGALVAETAAASDNPASLGVTHKLGYLPAGEDYSVAPRGLPIVHRRFALRRENWRRDLYPVRIENLDPCLAMFGVG